MPHTHTHTDTGEKEVSVFLYSTQNNAAHAQHCLLDVGLFINNVFARIIHEK